MPVCPRSWWTAHVYLLDETEDPMAEVSVQPTKNGPNLIRGPITLLDVDGTPYEVTGEVIALCRCGGSANKPFCDGTHAKEGFSSEPRVASS